MSPTNVVGLFCLGANMAIRRIRDPAAFDKLMDKVDRFVHRIYLLWVGGLIVGAIKLKPVSISIAGASFTLERPEAISGMIFLLIFGYYIAIVAAVLQSPWTIIESS